MKLIENVRESLEYYGEIINYKAQIDYINRLSEIGFYAVDLGTYSSPINKIYEKLDFIIDSIKKQSTKISVYVVDETSFYKTIYN